MLRVLSVWRSRNSTSIPNPRDSTSSFNALPGVAFAYTGLKYTTLYGGYHRGITTKVLRNEDFPVDDEIGDNFSLGVRSSAFKGLDFEVAGFYQLFERLPVRRILLAVTADREFGRSSRGDDQRHRAVRTSQLAPFTGGPLNFFTEGNYTYARSVLEKAIPSMATTTAAIGFRKCPGMLRP